MGVSPASFSHKNRSAGAVCNRSIFYGGVDETLSQYNYMLQEAEIGEQTKWGSLYTLQAHNSSHGNNRDQLIKPTCLSFVNMNKRIILGN